MAFIDRIFETADTRAQTLLLSVLDQLAEGVIVADAEGRLIYVNSAAAAIHGVSALHVTPDKYTETYRLLTVDENPYPPEDLPLSRTVMRGELVENARWKIRRPDDVMIDAVGTSRPVINRSGEQVASVLTLADRTDQIAAQESLTTALATKDALLLEVNHRVKNNLALVNSLLGLYAKRIDDEDAKRAFSDASARISVLVDIHRRLYALESHRRIEVVDLLIRMTQDTVRSLSLDREIDLVTRQEGSCELNTDQATTLALALNELVLNSLKHAFHDVDKPSIELDIVARHEKLDIIYCDNGPGVPENVSGGGTGIGRALVSQLATALSATYEQQLSAPGFCVNIEIALERLTNA